MSIIHDIAELMLREGDIKAQEQREIVAADEERRQNKWYNRPLRTTLKALATVAPLFIPGGPLAGVFGDKWAHLADSPYDKWLASILNDPAGASPNLGASPGHMPAGLGYTQFFGPMTRGQFPLDARQTVPFSMIPPWDEEGIG